MFTEHIYLKFSSLFSLGGAEYERLSRSEGQLYNYIYQLIRNERSEKLYYQLDYFLSKGFDPNFIPSSALENHERYYHLLYLTMIELKATPLKFKCTISLLNAGANLSYIIDLNGHPNLSKLLAGEKYSASYMRLLITHGLYIPALESFPCENTDKTLRIAEEEPELSNVHKHIELAQSALKVENPDYNSARLYFEQAYECFQEIIQKEELRIQEDDGCGPLLISHYKQRALDCQEKISSCYSKLDSLENASETEASALLLGQHVNVNSLKVK